MSERSPHTITEVLGFLEKRMSHDPYWRGKDSSLGNPDDDGIGGSRVPKNPRPSRPSTGVALVEPVLQK